MFLQSKMAKQSFYLRVIYSKLFLHSKHCDLDFDIMTAKLIGGHFLSHFNVHVKFVVFIQLMSY